MYDFFYIGDFGLWFEMMNGFVLYLNNIGLFVLGVKFVFFG